VVQYDFVKQGSADNPQDKRLNFAPRPPSSTFLEAARFLEAKPKAHNVALGRWIRRAAEETEVRKPTSRFDVLYQDDVVIAHPKDVKRRGNSPRIFSGAIGAANVVQRDPEIRNFLRDNYQVKAIEMEGSGIADAAYLAEKSYFIVRGTCDYCDVHKNDDWQHYAAVVAAYVRTLLEVCRPLNSAH
jgi:nucleoside phosphorylase